MKILARRSLATKSHSIMLGVFPGNPCKENTPQIPKFPKQNQPKQET